jgi:CubicO group peptidase (beta-lactamase class C family)
MTDSTSSLLPDDLVRDLRRTVVEAQRNWRVPGVFTGVARGGELIWSHGVGAADVDDPGMPPDPDTQFAIGSITKTFTATMIMALRDEGALRLDDPLSAYIESETHGRLPIRSLLAHASGLQREIVGQRWEGGIDSPDDDELLKGLDDAEAVLPHRRRWHYSNLAYSILGQVVAALDDRSWAESLQARILDPLGLRRTTLQPVGVAATGYFTDPHTDEVHPEQRFDTKAMSPAGALWSTGTDLARYAHFLAEGHDDVLTSETLDEMSRPEIMADLEGWSLAFGLGLMLFRSKDRILVGHSGGMPGFVAHLAVRRPDDLAAITLFNTHSYSEVESTGIKLLTSVLDAEPFTDEAWRPSSDVPDELRALVGTWWSEGQPYTFTVRDGKLTGRHQKLPESKPPAVFEPIDADAYRTVSGREEGERLVVVRDDEGNVVKFYWASYPFSRTPDSFS